MSKACLLCGGGDREANVCLHCLISARGEGVRIGLREAGKTEGEISSHELRNLLNGLKNDEHTVDFAVAAERARCLAWFDLWTESTFTYRREAIESGALPPPSEREKP